MNDEELLSWLRQIAACGEAGLPVQDAPPELGRIIKRAGYGETRNHGPADFRLHLTEEGLALAG